MTTNTAPDVAVWVLYNASNGQALTEYHWRATCSQRRCASGIAYFPAGKREPGDHDIMATLDREMGEELRVLPLCTIPLKVEGLTNSYGSTMYPFLVVDFEGVPPEYSLDDHEAMLQWKDLAHLASAGASPNVRKIATAALEWLREHRLYGAGVGPEQWADRMKIDLPLGPDNAPT